MQSQHLPRSLACTRTRYGATQNSIKVSQPKEDYGLAKRAMKVYEQAMKAVPENEKMNVYEIYIARSTEIFGVPSTREIYEVYLGGQYINNPTLSDVTFLVEGKRFYAHRIALLASSDAFRAMFDGGYQAF